MQQWCGRVLHHQRPRFLCLQLVLWWGLLCGLRGHLRSSMRRLLLAAAVTTTVTASAISAMTCIIIIPVAHLSLVILIH